MARFKSVTQAEFDAFLKAYPRPLTTSVYRISEPPLMQFNDLQRAPYWPDSVVASYRIDGGYQPGVGPNGWMVLEDIDAPIEDDGRRDCATPLHDSAGLELREGDQVDAHWGGSYSYRTGQWTPKIRRETIKIRDVGTKYEHWSFESCHNLVRGFRMWKVVDGVSTMPRKPE